ncbi:MAG: hypothetical protein U0903_12840 [Planctomycetales bacterium]
MSSIVAMSILLGVVVVCAVGASMFFDAAFRQARAEKTRRRIELPWMSGEALRQWGTQQGRKLVAARLKEGSAAEVNARLIREGHRLIQNVLDEVQDPDARGCAAMPVNCEHASPPQVTISEALAIVEELQELSPNVLVDVERHVGAIPGGTSRGNENPGCALLSETGFCVCSYSQPLACATRCRAGLDMTPEEREWSTTLQEGVQSGIERELCAAGLDAREHTLSEALRVVFLEKEAAARWGRGERLL